ncbi:MAG TPA: sigma-70 family RNA polymerase sigma factor [Terriglobales bacterium]|nr:sigma-70 family RNA polymerase sigma factor [Terriglobales bacterium]
MHSRFSEEAIQIIGDTRQKEFEQLALVHLRALLRAAVRLARDVAIAEDLVQDAMLRAWRHFDRFQPGTNCKAWLFRIMLNCWTTRHQQIRQEAIQFFPEQYAENTGDERRPPTRFTAEEIQNSIDLLNEEYRTVLLLFAVEGFSCKEIAEILGIPIGTVMSRLSRARTMVKCDLSKRETRYMKAKARL